MKKNCGPRPLAAGLSDASLWREKLILSGNQYYLDMSMLAGGSGRISVRLPHLGCGTARKFHAIALEKSAGQYAAAHTLA